MNDKEETAILLRLNKIVQLLTVTVILLFGIAVAIGVQLLITNAIYGLFSPAGG